tara:strand:+ start:24839 stop:26314 length:1476 start_codon:yes stop_codon:yes gene_type:complete
MIKKRFLALFLGLNFSLGFAPFDIWILSLISIFFVLYLLEVPTTREIISLGFYFGIGMWSLGISWVFVSIYYHGDINIIYSILITLLFIILLSLFNSITFLLYALSKTSNAVLSILFILPFSWLVVELIRSNIFTGFPWLITGSIFSDSIIDSWIPILGAQATGYFALFLPGLFYLILNSTRDSKISFISIAGIFFVLTLVLDEIKWTKKTDEIDVLIVQPNLSLKDKWSWKGLNHTKELIENSIETSSDGTLIVFPETALILEQKELEEWINKINTEASKKNISLLTGIVERKEPKFIMNRVMGIGLAKGNYDKRQLVPFGEYVPLERYLGNILDFLSLELTNTISGKDNQAIYLDGKSISVNICYEIAFSELVRKDTHDKGIIITVSNDTWFGDSFGPYQHLEIAQTRALENGKFVIRSTSSGISAIIDDKGRILSNLMNFKGSYLEDKAFFMIGNTPYSSLGQIPLYLYFIIVLFYIIMAKLTDFRRR